MRSARFATGKLRSLRLMISADMWPPFVPQLIRRVDCRRKAGFRPSLELIPPCHPAWFLRFGRAHRRSPAGVRGVRGHVRARVRRRRLDRRDARRQPDGHRARPRARDRGDGLRGRSYLGRSLQPGGNARLPRHAPDRARHRGRLLGVAVPGRRARRARPEMGRAERPRERHEARRAHARPWNQPGSRARDRAHSHLLPRLGDLRDGRRPARRLQVDRRPRDRLHDHARHLHGWPLHGRRDEPGSRLRAGARPERLERRLGLVPRAAARRGPGRARVRMALPAAALAGARRAAGDGRRRARPRARRRSGELDKVPPALIFALSSGSKTAIVVLAAIFTRFALLWSMLNPRWRPQFPGRGLWVFVGICVLLFLGMITTVIVFGKESKSEAAGSESTTTSASQTTSTTTTAAPAAKTVKVAESEWKVVLPKTLSSGKY